jgi:S-formylglutathione hydrolase FrmB
VLTDAGQLVKLRSDAYSCAVAGASSGGVCAFTMAWFRPDRFSRVHSVIGSFTGLQWDPAKGLEGGFMLSNLARREPRRNIRVWMSDGSNDFEIGPQGFRDWFRAGSWPLNNIQLANALKLSGYDFSFRFGEGFHSLGQAALDLPESLAWLWRDYDPERTEQTYEQDSAEREKPVFRVRIANRDGEWPEGPT